MFDILGAYIAAFLTLCIFSFLIGDNPFYKLAEHIFVGLSAGYGVILALNQSIVPSIESGLNPQEHIFVRITIILSIILGFLTLTRLEVFSIFLPKLTWISRIPIAFIVGVSSGISVIASIQGYIFPQTLATFLPLISPNYQLDLSSPLTFLTSFLDLIGPIVIFIGVIAVLIYFFFSGEQKGLTMWISKIGIIIIMITFGATFGYTIMGRFSLLISRIYFLISDVLGLLK